MSKVEGFTDTSPLPKKLFVIILREKKNIVAFVLQKMSQAGMEVR